MIIKLCYKEYDAKMSLKAMKDFKAATGKDLWFTLLSFLEAYSNNENKTVLSVCTSAYKVVDFETASQVFYCMIKAATPNIPLIEIEDAMFKVGWLPSERDDDMSEPWPMVMSLLASEVQAYFAEEATGKKPLATTKQ